MTGDHITSAASNFPARDPGPELPPVVNVDPWAFPLAEHPDERVRDVGFDSPDGTRCWNPFVDENGRPVLPDHYGFRTEFTGGNCTAWIREEPDGTGFMVTDAGEPDAPMDPGTACFALGLYDWDSWDPIWVLVVNLDLDVYGATWRGVALEPSHIIFGE